MYLNMFGGSGLLHILAGHPRVVAAFGLVGAVGLLASPVGPGTYRGTGKYASAIERVIHDQGTNTIVANAERQAAGEMSGTREQLEPLVQHTIAACGTPVRRRDGRRRLRRPRAAEAGARAGRHSEPAFDVNGIRERQR
jgi:hypothetical protein